jgi:hypothetical protein
MQWGNTSGSIEDIDKVAITLIDFIKEHRYTSKWDAMILKAIRSLGNLNVEMSVPILIEALIYDNPALNREAAKALSKVVGPKISTDHILEAFVKNDMKYLGKYANALQWINENSIVEEELETSLVSGTPERQEAARKLLYKIGGPEAFHILRARKTISDEYIKIIKDIEDKIHGHFETTIKEARKGFKVTVRMDIVVFILGISLLAFSAYMAFVNSGTLENWAGISITSGGGVLAVVYGTLVAEPRNRVQKAVLNLMYYKVVFLAYLTQLHQVNQAYTRLILEEKKIESKEIKDYHDLIKKIMIAAITKLNIKDKEKIEKNDKKKSDKKSIF